MCQNQHYISEYPYQETVYKVSFFLFPNIHSKTYVRQDTSSRAPFRNSPLHSDNPKIVSTNKQFLPNMVPSGNPSKPAIHQKTNRSIIPVVQRYRSVCDVTPITSPLSTVWLSNITNSKSTSDNVINHTGSQATPPPPPHTILIKDPDTFRQQ